MAFADTQKLVVELDLEGNLTRGLADATRSVKNFDKATGNTQRSLGKFGRNIEKTALVAAGAVATAGVILVRSAADYESAFAGVVKTVDDGTVETGKALQELSKDIRALAKEIPVSAAELASLGEIGGALGVPIEQMEEFIRVTALLGVTTDLTAEDAANSLGILGNVLHLTGDDYDNFASSLVALGNAGASTESQIIAIAERAGAAGDLVGVTADKILGFSSAIASLGIEPEAGGTALQKFFIDSARAVAEGGDELKVFAKITGRSAKDFKKAFEKDAGGALQEFLADLGKLNQGDQLRVLEDLGFNDARITRTLLGLANNSQLVADQMGIANTAFKENTALTKEADARFKTFDSQLQITKNILTDVAITIGSKLLPKLVPLLQKLNAFVTDHQGDIERFGDDLAKAFSDVAENLQKVDWQPFIDGLKFTADVGRTAIGIFQSMPDWLQKLIVAGFAVNKFTGGLVTSLGKDLIGAIGGQFLSRGSPGNPMWVKSVDGGFGGPGGKGPGGLGLGALGALGAGVVILGVTQKAAADLTGSIVTSVTGDAKKGAIAQQVQTSVGGGPVNIFGPFERIMRALNGDLRSPLEVVAGNTKAIGRFDQSSLNRIADAASRGVVATERAESNARADAAKVAAQIAAGDTRSELAIAGASARQVAATGLVKAATDRAVAAANATAAAARHAGQQTAAAIRDKDLSVKVTVPVSIRNYNAVQKQVNTLYKVAS